MLRYAVLGMIGLVANSAWAQQAPPQAETSAPSLSAAPVQHSKAAVSMEEPLPGDHWTYEVRDEITGTVSATRANVVTEVTPADISVRFKIVGTSNEGLNVYDRSWNLINSEPWRFSPSDGTGIQAPLKSGRPGNSDYSRRYVRDLQNRNDLFDTQRQRSNQEKRGDVADLVRACDRSLGQTHLCQSSQQASECRQHYRAHRIWPQAMRPGRVHKTNIRA